jgi:two-component system cell cycle sensor histidine kinase/response regulator CckA
MSGEKVERATVIARALGVLFVSTRVPAIAVRVTGEFMAANDAALQQYGYSMAELLELRIHDLQATPRPIDGDLARAHAGHDEALDRRAHRRKDGSVLWVVPTAGPIDVLGETLVVSVLKDVTALVGAEARARFDEDRVEVMWQATVERLTSGFALLDAERRIVRANAAMAAFLQIPVAEIVGKRCHEVFSVCQRKDRCPHQVVHEEQRRWVQEIIAARTQKPIRVEVLPALANVAGIATVHVAQDLSEERAVRTQLVSNDRLATIGRLAAGVAHEVNNPAGFVTLALQLLKDQLARGQAPPSESVTIVDEAITAMLQINQIMRDLTGFTRERARSITDLTMVANSAIRIATHETRMRAQVERVFSDDVVAEVRGARVAQVLLNLIVNAAQAIPAGSPETNRIEVHVHRDADAAYLDVVDSGPGVPASIGERIFEPFFTTREGTGGTGLGLWLSRAIIEEEGGTLTFANMPAGGARFRVRLPMARSEAPQVESEASTASLPSRI